ncbi:MAG: ABC transporter ATP-binding protein [Phycisphaerae bacterium]|nr:ABC transporter ATP-binding protein [Phycisphaerae bacterium]
MLETLRLGLNNLRLHMLRSTLTSLGIILGVAAVILMVAIGEGNKNAAIRDIQALGAKNIIIRSQRPPESSSSTEQRSLTIKYGLTDVDLARIESFMTGVEKIVPVKTVGSEVSFDSRRTTSQTFGTTPELQETLNLKLQHGGRYLASEDLENRSRVAVIGNGISQQFFPLQDPIGKKIRIDDQVFAVIGVLEEVGVSGGAGAALIGRDLNLDIHIPLSTAKMEFGDVYSRRTTGSFAREEVRLAEIYITAQDAGDVIAEADRVRRLMEIGHSEDKDVTIIVPWELLENVKKTTFAMNILLTAIAAISLLVGGIGIMNIMLASVIERTREIGIRRAMGATRRHIVSQFLVETGTLSAVGGIIGILLGVTLSITVSKVLPWILSLGSIQRLIDVNISFEAQITGWSIIVSFLVASTTGVVFGIYPAVIASRQDPIQALRHE